MLQHLKELLLHTDVKRSDRFFYFTTCGWMMWNWLVSGLATGATVVLYEGSPFYPGPEAMFDLIDVRVVLFVRLRDDVNLDDDLQDRIRQVTRKNATPRHVPARIIQVNDIPRTVSGKIVELAVRNIVHDNPVKNVDALANPEALDLYENLPELQS